MKREGFPDWVDGMKQRARRLRCEVVALGYAYRDRRTPWYARAVSFCVVAYAFSPVDLIPDFIPVLGYLDDLVLIPLGITLALRLIPGEVMADARVQADIVLAKNRSTGWLAAALIVALWLVVLFILGRVIWHLWIARGG